jgi:hypothetical protein
MPALVAKLTNFHDGWIVGSAAISETPRDFDVLIPFSQWAEAAQLIPQDARPNSLGGWKCMSEGMEVDVFPGELSMLLALGKTRAVWHPKSDMRFARIHPAHSPQPEKRPPDANTEQAVKGL